MSASGPFFRQVLVCAKKSLIIHAAKQCTSKSEACWIHGQALKGLMEWYKARRILFPQRLSVCTSSNLCIATVHAQTKSTYTAVYRMLTPPDAPFHWSKFCQQRIHFRDEQGQLHFLMHCYHCICHRSHVHERTIFHRGMLQTIQQPLLECETAPYPIWHRMANPSQVFFSLLPKGCLSFHSKLYGDQFQYDKSQRPDRPVKFPYCSPMFDMFGCGSN
jgi:hypothetical protein